MEQEKQQKHFLKLLESNPPKIENGELFYTLPAAEVLKVVKSPIAPERKEHEVNGNGKSGKQNVEPIKKRGRGRPRKADIDKKAA